MTKTILDSILSLPIKVGTIAFASNNPLLLSTSTKVVTGGNAVFGGSSTSTSTDTNNTISIPTNGRGIVLTSL